MKNYKDLEKLLKLPIEQSTLAVLSDRSWGYAITYFDPTGYGFTPRQITNLGCLREKLLAAEKAEIATRLAQPKPSAAVILCDCGHTTPQSSVLSASLGSSCQCCYDRMSR